MPRQSWPPPIQHHRLSGRARVRWKGKDYYLGPYGSAEAARNYAELLTRLASGESVDRPTEAVEPRHQGITVAEVVSRWLAEESPRYPAAGRELQGFRYAVRPLIRLYGPLPAAAFCCDHLERVQLAMAAGTWQDAGEQADARRRGYRLDWSRNVVNRRIVRLRTIWRWAERKRLAPAGSYAHLCTLPGLKATDARVRHLERRRPATMAEVNAVVKYLPPVGRAMLLCQWWSGARSGEIRKMRGDEVDTSGEVWLYRPGTHKMSHKGQARVVPLGRRAQAVLRPWLQRCEPGGYVFPPSKRYENGNGCYTDWGYAQMVRRAAEKAGLPAGFSAYCARHGAKQRLTRSLGLDAARAVLGQRSLGTTAQYGDAIDEKAAKDAARKLG